MTAVDPIRYTEGKLLLLDQRVLPAQTQWIACHSATDAANAIRDMVVRGAPAISITAAYGMALAVHQGEDLEEARAALMASRPTAVNLRWALERIAAFPPEEIAVEAHRIQEEDLAINQAIGHSGSALLPENAQLYTHCNTGALATGGWGTALGVIRSAWKAGNQLRVFAGETRPYLQGARLTAWEMEQEDIPCTLVTDSMAATLMAQGKIDAVLVGCDRVAANGDTANKIGTLSLAVLAQHYGVAFYVCMPMSTLDRRCPSGAEIPIEERPADEVRGHGGIVWAANVDVYNPAFDVTPAALITAWITEHGVQHPPFAEAAPDATTG